MSSQGGQRARGLASPSTTKQGPIKATQPFGLVHGSPTKSLESSENRAKARRSPDVRASPDRLSPSSPSLKAERPKAVRQSPVSCIKRTGSLDALAGLYTSGQWPKEFRDFQSVQSHTPTPTTPPPTPTAQLLSADKCTQTVEDWDSVSASISSKRKNIHQRSSSLGNAGDHKKENFKSWSKKSDTHRNSPGLRSPIPGSAAPCSPVSKSPVLTNITPSNGSHAHQLPASKNVGIPHSSKRSVIRIRGSVEGPSTEIERAMNVSDADDLIISLRNTDLCEGPRDGHCAPITELLRYTGGGMRSIDTQTPSGGYYDDVLSLTPRAELHSPLSEGCETAVTNSGRGCDSPSFPFIVGQMDSSRPSSTAESPLNESDKENDSHASNSDKDLMSPIDPKNVPSPRPNKSFLFVREPPDGCEKVNCIEETRSAPPLKEPLMCCPIQKFSLIPSLGSAFNPPCKHPITPSTVPLTSCGLNN